MGRMTSRERFIAALKGQEPDVVPHFDGVDPKVMNAILPGASHEEFVEYMDIDAIGSMDKTDSWSYETVDAAKGIRRDQWGALVQFGTEVGGHPMAPAINSEEDLDSYVPPDPDESWRYEKLNRLLKRFKGERAVFAHATDVFNIASDWLLGAEKYYQYMITKPDLVDRANEIALEYNLGYLKNCLALGVDFVFITGDFAMTKGPFVSPNHTRRFMTPALKTQVDLAHSMNVPVLKHTDGNIWKILDDLVDTGIDGLHPIDPIAGMDLGEVKKQYGDRLCLAGNVNCGPTLSWGTVEEVRQEVRSCIKKAGYGGGYICMSSNSVHSGVKPENYVAMVKAIREFGRYPLDLD